MFISKTSSRRLQYFLRTCLQDAFKTCLQDMSSRRLQDVFSVTIFCLPRHLQDVLWDVLKTSLTGLQDVFARRLQDVFKKLWKAKYYYADCCVEDVFTTGLEDQQMFAWMVDISIIITMAIYDLLFNFSWLRINLLL